jgi:hypothetical protein
MQRRFALPAVLTGIVIALALAGVGLGGGRPLHASLSGSAEVPGPGDPDGSGSARVTLNQGARKLCWRIHVTNLTLPAAAAHIHSAVAGVAGPIVVPLSPPDASGNSSGCATGVSRDLIKAIRQSPANYYVNVHTSDFPAGAARGQLSK